MPKHPLMPQGIRNMTSDIAVRSRGQRDAILSSCFGAVSQVMVRDSSIIILYATMLGAAETISLFTTSTMQLAECLLAVPFALLARYTGKKRLILIAAAGGSGMLIIAASAPWAGPHAQTVFLGAIVGFAVTISAYLSVWFALLDGVVLPHERSSFFGRMRFSWQFVSIVFVALVGWVVGVQASLPVLQGAIAVAALLLLGRFWFVNDMHEVHEKETHVPLGVSIARVIRDRKLIGFAVYLFFLYSAANATVPLIFMFAKKHLLLADNVVVILSACSMGGLLTGYFAAGKIISRYGLKWVFLIAHFGFGVLNIMLLFVRASSILAEIMLAFILFFYGLLFACASVAVSSEMLALAPKKNKTLSIAVVYSLYTAGLGLSRMLGAVIIGSGVLASSWTFGVMVFSKYHTLFLVYGVTTMGVSVLLVLVPALTQTPQRLPHE